MRPSRPPAASGTWLLVLSTALPPGRLRVSSWLRCCLVRAESRRWKIFTQTNKKPEALRSTSSWSLPRCPCEHPLPFSPRRSAVLLAPSSRGTWLSRRLSSNSVQYQVYRTSKSSPRVRRVLSCSYRTVLARTNYREFLDSPALLFVLATTCGVCADAFQQAPQ